MHDVVDEVEADRLPGGEDRRARELRQRELAVKHAFCGERGQHGFGGRTVVGDGIGAEAAGTPPRQVAVAGCGGGESVVLSGHMGDQAVQRPVRAGRGARHVGRLGVGQELDAGADRLRVEGDDLCGNSRHTPMIRMRT
ncbi:MAG TPA: hypothetical protein VH594_11645 [Trebonia sp.]